MNSAHMNPAYITDRPVVGIAHHTVAGANVTRSPDSAEIQRDFVNTARTAYTPRNGPNTTSHHSIANARSTSNTKYANECGLTTAEIDLTGRSDSTPASWIPTPRSVVAGKSSAAWRITSGVRVIHSSVRIGLV